MAAPNKTTGPESGCEQGLVRGIRAMSAILRIITGKTSGAPYRPLAGTTMHAKTAGIRTADVVLACNWARLSILGDTGRCRWAGSGANAKSDGPTAFVPARLPARFSSHKAVRAAAASRPSGFVLE